MTLEQHHFRPVSQQVVGGIRRVVPQPHIPGSPYPQLITTVISKHIRGSIGVLTDSLAISIITLPAFNWSNGIVVGLAHHVGSGGTGLTNEDNDKDVGRVAETTIALKSEKLESTDEILQPNHLCMYVPFSE